MAKVGIVTDTTNCLQPELIKEYNIRVAPMTYTMEGKTYRDGVDITSDAFYKISKNHYCNNYYRHPFFLPLELATKNCLKA